MASGTQTQYQDRNPKAVTNGPTTVRLGAVVGAKAELGIGAGWHEGGSAVDGFGGDFDYGSNSDRRFMIGACAAAFSQSAGKHASAFVLCFQEGDREKGWAPGPEPNGSEHQPCLWSSLPASETQPGMFARELAGSIPINGRPRQLRLQANPVGRNLIQVDGRRSTINGRSFRKASSTTMRFPASQPVYVGIGTRPAQSKWNLCRRSPPHRGTCLVGLRRSLVSN
jgi:hypothetical protein